jgi:RNA polymerase sigma-70 factor (ECF subfamily)
MPATTPTTEFVQLWMLYGQRIYSYILALTSNYADADEIYQEVGVTLWEKFAEFEPGSNFQAWARQVALYKVRNFQKLRRHETVLCTPEFLDVVARRTAEQESTLSKQQKAFVDCYEKLPSRHKELVERRYQPGATTRSVAEQTGRKLKAVYQALDRIHNALFDCVQKATFERETS